MTRRALILFVAMSLIWGIPYLFIRIAVQEITPATLVFGRTGIASLILVPIAFLTLDLRPVLARWRWVVAFALVEVAGPWVLLGTAEQQIPSSLAGLLVAGVPLVGTVLAFASGSEHRMSRDGLAGLTVGILGVAAIVGVNVDARNAPAIFEMLLVVVGYAVGPWILSHRLSGLPSLGVMSLSLSLCALIYLPIAVVQRPAVLPGMNVLAAVLILGLICTAAAFVLFGELIDEIGPVRSTVVAYVNPAVAAVLGVLVLSERFTTIMAIGLGLVLFGSVLATRRPRTVPVEAVLVPSGETD